MADLIGKENASVSQCLAQAHHLRHEFRNYLNIIKLTSAVLQRQHAKDDSTIESLREIDQAVDHISELVKKIGSLHSPVAADSVSSPDELSLNTEKTS